MPSLTLPSATKGLGEKRQSPLHVSHTMHSAFLLSTQHGLDQPVGGLPIGEEAEILMWQADSHPFPLSLCPSSYKGQAMPCPVSTPPHPLPCK